MVKITIQPSALIFKELPSDLLVELQEQYNLEVVKGGYQLSEEPSKLYHLLFKISFTYDLELI